ncbi:glycosyltransferase family 2 protein [bacterium]|nr:glycosyltransferase family 2 protein [bacterium]
MQEKKLYTTVDILIPCHNRANDIKNLINHLYSIECPKNIKFSIHVIDDLSSDNSVETIKNLQKKYSSLFLIQNEANMGIYFNRFLLINNSNADYIFFMDDDDDIDDNLFIEFAKYSNYDLVRTIRKFVTNEKVKISFEATYKKIKKPVDMINLMNLYFITGTFISKYVYSKMMNVLTQLNDNYLNLNIYDDQPYFYLMVNFSRSFIFIDCYYYYIFNVNGLIQSTDLIKTSTDGLRI